MTDLILWDMLSLEGYLEGPNHQIDWSAFDPVLKQYTADTQLAAGTLLFGRRTYEGTAAYSWESQNRSPRNGAAPQPPIPRAHYLLALR